jgi:tRNA 5-methylaminomethyl-2-thiouridine biosynthesis bifunctional protein
VKSPTIDGPSLALSDNALMQPDMDPIEHAIVDWSDGTPAAPSFRDHYYSTAGGADESRLVFLQGARLPQRFEALSDHDGFVIGETGFGTGLNLLLAADLFLQRAAPGARLHLVSAEKHPLRIDDLRRALGCWPELKPLSDALIERWPAATPGFHRIELHPRVSLTLMFGDAEAMWQAQEAAVDAWFLDGFAPRRNASMWTPKLFARLAELSRPGAALATFSAAGDVRRGLAEVGFEAHRAEGFGHKRHRLEAFRPGAWRPRAEKRGTAWILGAGLAGCTVANILARRGWQCSLVDAEGIATAASGNRAGVVYTTPSGVATPQNRFYQSSWLHALRWLNDAEAERKGFGRFDGVEQIATDDRHRSKLKGALSSGHWPEDLLVALDDDRVLLRPGGVLQPRRWCRALADHPNIELRIDRVQELDIERPRIVLDEAGSQQGDAVIVCTAAGTAALLPQFASPLRTIRGQITELASTEASRRWKRAVCHAGYVTPEVDGYHCIGATFDLHSIDPAPRAGDDQHNLDLLNTWCPQAWRELGGPAIAVHGQRVGMRVTSRDYLPLVGPLSDGRTTWLSVAFGSRGISGTALAALLIADGLTGAPAAVDRTLRAALHPGRFAERAARRR